MVKWIVAAAAASLMSVSAQAELIEITQGEQYSALYYVGGMGTGRGAGFVADDSFSISSVGLDLSVASTTDTTYLLEIFSSVDGHTAGSVLASTSFNLTAGTGWMDQAMTFTFNAGSSYILNFSRADNQLLDGIGIHYAWESASSLVDYGPFSVVDGFEGATPHNSNPLIPFIRLDTGLVAAVPEPATWAFMIIGFGAVGASMRSARTTKLTYATA